MRYSSVATTQGLYQVLEARWFEGCTQTPDMHIDGPFLDEDMIPQTCSSSWSRECTRSGWVIRKCGRWNSVESMLIWLLSIVTHRKVFRPWGWYDGVDGGERFQVKRIMVKPGAMLSLQMHHHRAEHWIVVRGDEVFLVTENQSIYIPLGERHRLENPGTLPLEMIEVQSGSYIGEDDIVRFEDSYGRLAVVRADAEWGDVWHMSWLSGYSHKAPIATS